MIIHCEERYNEARKYAESIGMLDQFDSVFNRLKEWEKNENCPVEINIYGDFTKHSFTFSETYLREDLRGREGICGGIIYHGCPKEGYRTAGSVMMSPSYGWHIHT